MSSLILITRPEKQARAFAADLRADLGPNAVICVAPLLEIEAVAFPDPGPFKTLILTSAHAAAGVSRLTCPNGLVCYAVGEATSKAARANGLDPIIGPGTAKALADQILQDKPPTPCLYLRGEHTAYDMAEKLNSAGLETHQAVAYRQVARALSADVGAQIAAAKTVIAPVFSPRSAEILLSSIGNLTDLRIAAISQSAAQAIPPERVSHIGVAAHPDKASMLACVAQMWRDSQSA